MTKRYTSASTAKVLFYRFVTIVIVICFLVIFRLFIVFRFLQTQEITNGATLLDPFGVAMYCR